MRRIGLLYVITKLELGGAQKQLLSLVSRLDKEKFRFFLITAKDGILLPDALSIPGLTVKKSLFLERNINPLKDILAMLEIYFFIKRNKISIVHTHSSKAGILGRFAARLAGLKIIIHTVHGWPFNDYQPHLVKKLFVRLEKLAARFTNIIIVVSHHDLRKGLENNIAEESRYKLIRYGIDYKAFISKKNAKAEFGIGINELVVTNISCLKPQKSPCDFVRLASLVNKQLPNVKFLLVGDGVLRSPVEKLIRELNLQERMILTGWRKDIPGILSITDALVLTSLWEGLPVVVLEAMAAGCPVIATQTGAVGEVITEEMTGYLVPCRDLAKMSERLIGLLNNRNAKTHMGETARLNLNSNFTLENMVKNNQFLYEGLVIKEGVHVN